MNVEVLCAAPLEALAHSPSQMPLSCSVALPSQRELHKDGGGSGGGVARRARAARARKPKSCATSCGTSSTAPCAASFTCSSFMCQLIAGVCVWGARVRVAAQQHAFFGFRRSKMTRATPPSFAAPGFRRMKMTRATTSKMVVVAAAVLVTSLVR